MSSMEGYVSLEEIEEYNKMVHQTFRTDTEFYDFYNLYARCKGFSIRKENLRRNRDTNRVNWRKFSCSFKGYRRLEHFDRTDRKRQPRAMTRCDCNAFLEIQLCPNSGMWYVKDFMDCYSHILSKPEHVYLLRSHRGLSDPQKYEAIELSLGSLRTCQIMDVMEKNYGGPDDTGFIMQDLYNFFATMKKERVEGRDAEFVLSYMRWKKEQDSEFFFKYSLDEDGRLQNLFWSDSQSRLDYGSFRDVVVFDSTYRVNRYNLPFVPFVGVDHHRSTVIFGCGIISNETTASYIWLLEVFLEAMGHRYPDSLITDGDQAMARAIEIVMPTADHRLCSWHIEQRMVLHLRGEKLRDFRKFIYHPMETEDFERRWEQFVQTYEIKDNDIWMNRMYDLRMKWSASYTKGRKFLGMQSNQRSESLNSRLHKHLDRLMSLVDLVEHYEFCLLRIRRTQVELDGRALNSKPYIDLHSDPFIQDAVRMYTPKMFIKVRRQIEKLSEWEVTQVSWGLNGSMMYEVASKGSSARFFYVTCTNIGPTVVNASCPCRLIECEGIPCSHIFTVLRSIHAHTIPPCLVLDRWTIQANCAFPVERAAYAHVWSDQMERFRALRKKAHHALLKVSWSVEEMQRVMEFLDAILNKEEDDYSSERMQFAPLPAHFSEAHHPSSSGVLNPRKIVSKGAPPSSRRLKKTREKMMV